MRFPAALILVLLALPAFAADLPTMAKAVSGDELTLSDGRTVRLEGIIAPSPETADLAKSATEKLQALILNQPLALENAATDRYGQTAAQVYVPGDKGARVWLEGELLQAGLAFVYPPTGEEPRIDDMLKLEREARTAERGIWNDAFYADIPADKAEKHMGRFAFVSGTVVDTARVKNKVYLNFGDDWKRDFTIAIAAKDLRAFRDAGIDPLTYKGKTIRVRGWIEKYYGPMVEVSSPAQLMLLTGP